MYVKLLSLAGLLAGQDTGSSDGWKEVSFKPPQELNAPFLLCVTQSVYSPLSSPLIPPLGLLLSQDQTIVIGAPPHKMIYVS